ncbi:MAG: hypothetical protein LBO68_00830 [Synergistaceae bacterium]|jgi:hypothetical protein|nr:hypothetical protein [Synergistaceae bacterium]
MTAMNADTGVLLSVAWPALNLRVAARLLDEFNPYACGEFLKTLPAKSIQSHSVVAGNQLYCPFRLNVDRSRLNRELMSDQGVGRLNIELDFQYLSINYGPITEAVPAVPLAQVTDADLSVLVNVGERIWRNLNTVRDKEFILVEFAKIVRGDGAR